MKLSFLSAAMSAALMLSATAASATASPISSPFTEHVSATIANETSYGANNAMTINDVGQVGTTHLYSNNNATAGADNSGSTMLQAGRSDSIAALRDDADSGAG